MTTTYYYKTVTFDQLTEEERKLAFVNMAVVAVEAFRSSPPTGKKILNILKLLSLQHVPIEEWEADFVETAFISFLHVLFQDSTDVEIKDGKEENVYRTASALFNALKAESVDFTELAGIMKDTISNADREGYQMLVSGILKEIEK